MERVEDESFWLCLPNFADEFVGREAFEGLEAFGEVRGLDEIGEVAAELIVGVVVEAPDGCVLDGAVHSLDLAVGPGMPWLGQSVINVGEGAGVFKRVRSERLTLHDHLADFGGGPDFTLRIGEVDAVVGQNGVDFVGHRLDQAAQEVGRGACCCLCVQLGEGELACAVDGDEEVELALGSLYLGDVDMEVADGVGLEGFLGRLVALDFG